LDPGLRRDDNEFECRWARECSMQRGPSYIHVGRLGNVPDQPSTSYIHVGRLGNVPDQPSTSYIHVGRLGNVPDQPSTSYIHVDTVLVVKRFVGQVEGCMVFHT